MLVSERMKWQSLEAEKTHPYKEEGRHKEPPKNQEGRSQLAWWLTWVLALALRQVILVLVLVLAMLALNTGRFA